MKYYEFSTHFILYRETQSQNITFSLWTILVLVCPFGTVCITSKSSCPVHMRSTFPASPIRYKPRIHRLLAKHSHSHIWRTMWPYVEQSPLLDFLLYFGHYNITPYLAVLYEGHPRDIQFLTLRLHVCPRLSSICIDIYIYVDIYSSVIEDF